jgi:hypothetical protein
MIPITAADEMLGTLDITDIRHPVLQRPSKGLSEITQAHIIPEITETASENIGRRDSSPGQSSPSSEATQRIIDTNEAEAEVYANSSMLSESRREDVIEIVGSDTAEGREDRSE